MTIRGPAPGHIGHGAVHAPDVGAAAQSRFAGDDTAPPRPDDRPMSLTAPPTRLPCTVTAAGTVDITDVSGSGDTAGGAPAPTTQGVA